MYFFSYPWKRHICALCSRPPLLHLDCSRHPLGRCSLISQPINSRKWIEAFFMSSCSHYTNGEIFCCDFFRPWRDGVVDCDGVVESHVIDSDQDVNLLVRVKAIWRQTNSLTGWIGPFWNTNKIHSSSHYWKSCQYRNRYHKIVISCCKKGLPLNNVEV